ncbi:hypothetical protein Tco_0557960 [Tanacetum coccineum]
MKPCNNVHKGKALTCFEVCVAVDSNAMVWPLFMSVQKLLDDQVIDSNGDPVTNKKNVGHRHEGMVAARSCRDCINLQLALELEPREFLLFPKILPHLAPFWRTTKTKQAGHFWNEDSSCITWLGSYSVPAHARWEYSQLGTSTRGLIPFPDVGCLMSHCGWNSPWRLSHGFHFCAGRTLLIQFFEATYNMGILKNRAAVEQREIPVIVTREEIKNKVGAAVQERKIKQNGIEFERKGERRNSSSKISEIFLIG